MAARFRRRGSTKESRGIEIATARAFGPAGTCSRMIVSVCSWPSSAPARSSASSSGGSGLPDASVRLSSPTSSAVNGCSGSGAAVRRADDVAGDDAVGQRPLDRPAVPGADQQRERQHRGDRAPDRARRPGAPGGRLRSSHAPSPTGRSGEARHRPSEIVTRGGAAPATRTSATRGATGHGPDRARRRGDGGHALMIGRHERRCRSRLGDRYRTAVTPCVRDAPSTSP